MNHHRLSVVVAALAAVCLASVVHAQSPAVPEKRLSFDVGLGFDNTLSGNINSGAIGSLNDHVVVVLPNSYDKVYGTGFHLRFGGGYMLDEVTEVRGTFTYQHLTAELTPLGDIGSSRLYAQFEPYKSLTLDAGLRRYFDPAKSWRAYTEGTVGIGFISRLEAELSAPAVNVTATTTDLYDSTTAFAIGGNVGVLWQASDKLGVYGQIGLRWMSGLSAVDNVAGTGLQAMNEGSSRWTMPIVFGVRTRF